jgi:acetyl-CoA synthetase
MSSPHTCHEQVPAPGWATAAKELHYGERGQYNIGYYCSDRPCASGLGSATAMIWQSHTGEERHFTYNDLRLSSNAFAHFFRGLRVGMGDRVCFLMDRVPELYFAFLGTLKIGAIAQPLFSAFGEEALFTRLADAETGAIVTTRSRVHTIRKIRDSLPHLKHIVVVEPGDIDLAPGETAFSLSTAPTPEELAIAVVGPETPSVLHYTSGTTGKPKGALHVHSSILAQYMTSRCVLDLHPGDLYWCTADPGWVTGTSYGIIGPWAIGVTQVIFDAGFSSDAWYAFLQRHRVTVWYTAPTAIRLLMRDGLERVRTFDLSSLRHLASVGEPLNPEAVAWSQKAFGKPFHDTFWQTETGAIMIANVPGMTIKPGSMGRPVPDVTATVVDPTSFNPVRESGTVGLIAFRPDWPSMFRAYWNNPVTYEKKFRNGWYLSGDRATVDADGYFWFVGRDDDVINTGGHLVGPFEIESALLEHPAVAESAAVGKPDPVNWEVVKAFVSLKPGYSAGNELRMEIMNHVRKRVAPFAMPQEIEFVDSLPRTRSGKIMRRLLHAREWHEELGDTSTLED